MAEGVPVRYSAPIKNPYDSTHGIIDLLVRSDYMSRLVNDNPLTEQEERRNEARLVEQVGHFQGFRAFGLVGFGLTFGPLDQQMQRSNSPIV